MSLSTRGRYGLRAAVDLACHHGQGPVSLKDIARRQDISEKYLEHIVAALKVAGLVRSVRGAYGGYILARPPAEITVNEIMQVLEGSFAPTECVEDPSCCDRACFCVARDLWAKVEEAIRGVLQSVTLQDLADQHQARMAHPETMYYI